MKKGIAFLFFIIFLTVNTCQVYKCIVEKDFAIENAIDNDEEKKSAEDYADFLKDKSFYQFTINLSSGAYQLKQYTDQIFRYTNPHNELDIVPPKFIS